MEATSGASNIFGAIGAAGEHIGKSHLRVGGFNGVIDGECQLGGSIGNCSRVMKPKNDAADQSSQWDHGRSAEVYRGELLPDLLNASPSHDLPSGLRPLNQTRCLVDYLVRTGCIQCFCQRQIAAYCADAPN